MPVIDGLLCCGLPLQQFCAKKHCFTFVENWQIIVDLLAAGEGTTEHQVIKGPKFLCLTPLTDEEFLRSNLLLYHQSHVTQYLRQASVKFYSLL